MTEQDSPALSLIQNSLVPVTRLQAMLMLESGYLWMDLNNFDRAREIFMGAISLMPRSEIPQIALGTMEFNLGAHEKALAAFRRAQKINPRSSLVRSHCGEVLLFMGKVNEALKELKAAVEIDADSDGAKFAQALIDAHNVGVLPPLPKAD